MTVGVVIPCRNEARFVGELLDAIAMQDCRPDEVVVVDDGSVDGTAGVVEARSRRDPMIRMIPGPKRGIPAAVNAGVAALTTDIVARFDGHCCPARDYIARAARLIAQSDVGVVGGVWAIEPGAKSLEAEAIAIAGAHPLGSGGAAYRTAGGSVPTDVDTVPFGCFKRSLWKDIGGFDERLESNEDYDFNYRVRQRGLRVVLDPAIRCTYYARSTIGALARQYGRYGWWKARMLTRHPESIRWRQLIPALLVPGLLAAAVGWLRGGGDVWGRLLVVYTAVILIGAVHAAATRGRWPAVGWLAGSFVTIQVAWSAAFWASLISGGVPHRGINR
ncbi:MAG: glycosyltransferase family 2 protein [Vicinamibacterales bacterium]